MKSPVFLTVFPCQSLSFCIGSKEKAKIKKGNSRFYVYRALIKAGIKRTGGESYESFDN